MKHCLIKLFSLLLFIPLNIFTANYDLCVCTIFQNDAEFLKEWIEFHRIQGVQHFYMYNNNSEDNFKEVLKPYIKAKVVTLTNWPYTYPQGKPNQWINIQCRAYQDCIDNYGENIKWLAFIDSDEFLFCPDGKKIPDFLEDYIEYGGVLVNWLLFGTSNVEDVPKNKLMIEVLTRCATRSDTRNKCVKSIVQPKYVVKPRNAHTFIYKPGYQDLTLDGGTVRRIWSTNAIHDGLRINHYWTRTERYFREHKIVSRGKRRSYETELELRNMADGYNADQNIEILQFVPELKKRMKK